MLFRKFLYAFYLFLLFAIDCQGSAAIEGICLDMSKIGKLHLSPTTFLKMRKLRLLKIYNASAVEESKVYLSEGLQYLPDALRYLRWDGYPLQAMPSQFTPQNLVELNMSYSQVERLWNGVQVICLKFF